MMAIKEISRWVLYFLENRINSDGGYYSIGCVGWRESQGNS
jgi:hypothetical protein